jgi:hypothetical protein
MTEHLRYGWKVTASHEAVRASWVNQSGREVGPSLHDSLMLGGPLRQPVPPTRPGGSRQTTGIPLVVQTVDASVPADGAAPQQWSLTGLR